MIEQRDIRIQKLKDEHPGLNVELSFLGQVLDINGDSVYVRLNDEFEIEEDMEAEMKISTFPPLDDFRKGTIFWLCLGEIEKVNFTHIGYFYWTQEEIEHMKKDAEEFAAKINEIFINSDFPD